MKMFFRYFLVFNVFLLNLVAGIVVEEENSKTSIVFVHIGPEMPRYLFTATKQALLFNPNSKVYVIVNRSAFEGVNFKVEDGIDFVFCENLKISENHRYFLENSKLDKKSFGGFWTFASERFFYLEEFIREKKLKNIFHLENDVMLYIEVDELLRVFERNYQNMIGATFDSDTRCIPGFMYISNIDPIEKLVELMAFRAKEGKNDMEILQEFKNIYDGRYIDHLPIINPEYVRDYELKNTLKNTAKYPENYFKFFDEFQSIFDAAAIGQYLGGISPRNGSEGFGFINETCLFNPSYASFIWKEDCKGRRVPYIVYKNTEYKINNLHVHSKNLNRFYSK